MNKLELPNRLLMSSLHMNLDEDTRQHQRLARFYALRARMGVGLIVTAGCSPDAAGKSSPSGFALDGDSEIPRHETITRAVHRAKGRIALQILHLGRHASHAGLVSSSARRAPAIPYTPRALDEAGITATVEAYAACAGRAVTAGYDAVELCFSQGFLVHQFLAPAFNTRSDRWGGIFENRARFAVAVARAVRSRVGRDFPIIFRLPCLDLISGGLSPEESVGLVEALTPFGIDLLNVGIGCHESEVATITMSVPRAAFAGVSARLRARFPGLIFAASNRINDPRLAERLLRDGCADMIAMGRPFLADAALADKARRGAFAEINTCIACNQSCMDFIFASGDPVGCSVAPDCARPEEGRFPPLAASKRVAVAGGGIAGLGAALFLARRGARVTLFESENRLGGQLQLAARVPDKQEFVETIRYYSHAALQAGVEIRLGRAFTADDVAAEPWDHVVLATGSRPRRLDDIPGIDLPHVIDYRDVLENDRHIAFPAVIIGGGGVACDVAKYLIRRAEAGVSVTILQRSSRKLAHKVGRTTRWVLMKELEGAGVTMLKSVDVRRVTPSEVDVIDRVEGRERSIAAGAVIVAAGHLALSGPVDDLRRQGIPFTAVGASRAAEVCNTNITSALREAYEFAMAFS
ncbi:MAG: FAD-dependent oxidoreductase [Elusimicrobia bacterium]|nr:FAD-dependent oxidoreductase [Elusimicrobiota bacterium]